MYTNTSILYRQMTETLNLRNTDGEKLYRHEIHLHKSFFPKRFSEKLFVAVEGIMNTMIYVLTYHHGGDLGSEG